MLVEGLVALLNADSEVTTICGDRIMPIPAPDDLSQYPCVTYQVASGTTSYTFTNPTGVVDSRVVFTCIAADYGNAKTLARALMQALSGYRGTLQDGTLVYFTEIANVQDGFDDGSRLSTTAVHALVTYLE